MKQTKISNIVTNTVTLGDSTYASHLTITASGGVEPSASGAAAILTSASLDTAKVTNLGTVQGATSTVNGQFGGNGIELSTATGVIINSGVIEGGASSYAAYVSGGMGVLLDGSGSVSNTGSIIGGAGYAHPGYHQNSYPGAVGVDVSFTATLTNKGFISGGSGLAAGPQEPYYQGPGGATGVIVGQASTVTNSGTILGGAGGGVGTSYARGNYGGAGIDFTAGGVLINHGLIQAGASSTGGEGGPSGQAGVAFAGAGTVTNTGTVLGGGSLDGGGSGLALYSGTVSNAGTIGGGSGGGIGVSFAQGGTLTNSGAIYGTQGAHLKNPDGGAGISLAGSGSITNHGTITGGSGAQPSKAPGGNGGAGVYLAGGTLTNFGTITGGLGGNDRNGNGTAGDAVQFGTTVATLVINPTAVFVGDIAADSTVVDTLELAGKGGMLAGLGTTVSGFTDIVEDASARWTLTGTVSGTGSVQIGTDGTLTLDGTISIAQIAFMGAATAGIGDPSMVTSRFADFGSGDVIDLHGLVAASLKYGGDKLTLYDASHTVVDTLELTGKHAQSDFALQSDGHGGTDVVYAGTGSSEFRGAADPQTGARADTLPQLWHGHVHAS